jgi:hypothetical protein
MGENTWRELYKAAILELDDNKLGERLRAAVEAIRARASLNGEISSEERIAIEDATSALQVLQQE